jgi:hypothetical protein
MTMISKLIRLFTLLIISGCMLNSVHAQTILYQEDFEGSNPLNKFLLSNIDKGIPQSSSNTPLKDSAWIIRNITETGSRAALGTSGYQPEITANDWLITPAIRLGKASYLEWDAMSTNAGKPDSYEVYISTSGQSVNSCLISLPVFTEPAEQAGSINHHYVSLSDSAFWNKTINIGYRLNTLGGENLIIDNIRVSDDSIQSLATLTFIVDMSEYIAAKNFNPHTDTVDIAGNFNNYQGEQHILSIIAETDSSRYAISIPGFHDGDVLQFKFRINSSWNDTALEFPYGGPNRIWTVKPGQYTYSAKYNKEGSIGFDEDSRLFADFRIFPNPAHDFISITAATGVDKLMIFNINGQLAAVLYPPFERRSVDISYLPPGLYNLMLYSSEKRVGTFRLIRN